MASLQVNPQFYCHSSSSPFRNRNLTYYWRFPSSFSRKVRVFTFRENRRSRNGVYPNSCFCRVHTTAIEKVSIGEENERPPFDINLAVILAGFAFEAYTGPPEKIGRREVDGAGCKTVYLSEMFVREIYDGQLCIKLKKGIDLPAMGPWGTSDPYVVMQLDGQVVKSKVKWGKKRPTWNQDFKFNIKRHQTKNLQVAAWDANLVTPHKRMGNAVISLEHVCDGNMHEVLLELEGMGGGGKLQLEITYKTFGEIEEEKKWWRIPIVTEFLRRNDCTSALTVSARQFVEYAFGQLKQFNSIHLIEDQFSNSNSSEIAQNSKNSVDPDIPSQMENILETSSNDPSHSGESNLEFFQEDASALHNGHVAELGAKAGETIQSNKHFWKKFSEVINQTSVQKLGLPASLELKLDEFDLLNKIGLQSQKIAEAGYIESGLAMPQCQDIDSDKASGQLATSTIPPSLPDVKKAKGDLLRKTDSILGALKVLTARVSELNKEACLSGKSSSESEKFISFLDGSAFDEKKAEEMRALFSTAESAIEAWAMLATSLGHPSFIKSEFEKVCFLDNESTDTQVAIWRDSVRKRLVVAFRGTEQARWKDFRTDFMVVPAGLNPERIGGDFKQEIQVHSGFLSAYDSVRIRLISVIKMAIGYTDDGAEPLIKWHIYVTGHSLGGALATLLALELSSSQLSKCGAISLTMYNFGSPRVGNKRFAEVYNQKVKDSWRIVNHRDIIPTFPHLMGYCHVAQPVYLEAGELSDVYTNCLLEENLELAKDGYQVDEIGELTPSVLINEFIKGEKELIEKILQTEISIFGAIRDGTAMMQHMEDFYYITLLENVRSNYPTVARLESNKQDSISIV